MKNLVLMVLFLINNISVGVASERIGPKPYIYYRYAILEEANGIGIIDVKFVNLSEFSSNRRNNKVEFTNNKKAQRILLNDNLNKILEHYVTIKYLKGHSPYGILKVDLKNGRTFYTIMYSDVTKIKIVTNMEEAYDAF